MIVSETLALVLIAFICLGLFGVMLLFFAVGMSRFDRSPDDD